MSESGLLCPGIIKTHSDLDCKSPLQRIRSPSQVPYSLVLLHMIAQLEKSQSLSAAAHCYAQCFMHTWDPSLTGIGRWHQRRPLSPSFRVPYISLSMDGARNSHHESQFDLGSQQGSKRQGHSLRNCFSKCIYYLGRT